MERFVIGASGTCNVNSPDASYGCVKKAGHEGECRNTSAQVSWCGLCMLWFCDKHMDAKPDGALVKTTTGKRTWRNIKRTVFNAIPHP